MLRMVNEAEGSSAAGLEEALAGGRDAFRVLVERHSPAIFRLAYRMTGNEHDAEEVVQETFLRAYRGLDKFAARSNFATWLYRIGMNCSFDLMRKRKAEADRREPEGREGEEPVLALAAEGPGPERLLLSAEVGQHVNLALATLTTAERAAFVMRHMEGLPMEAIAKTLGVRTASAKNSVFRAVKKLRHALEPFVSASSTGRP
jgi:RNA polymerase sigma-70 factor, ECF subfamily